MMKKIFTALVCLLSFSAMAETITLEFQMSSFDTYTFKGGELTGENIYPDGKAVLSGLPGQVFDIRLDLDESGKKHNTNISVMHDSAIKISNETLGISAQVPAQIDSEGFSISSDSFVQVMEPRILARLQAILDAHQVDTSKSNVEIELDASEYQCDVSNDSKIYCNVKMNGAVSITDKKIM